MRFMIIVKASKDSEAGVMPSEKLLAEMGKFNEELSNAGILLAGEGLHASSKGARVKFRGKFRAEIFRLEYLANLDLAVLVVRVGAAFDPLDRLFFGRDFPQPEPGDQLLGLGKRSVNDRARTSRKFYSCSF